MNEVMKPSVFEVLSKINVSEFIEKKPTGKKKQDPKTGVWHDTYLTYLSWANAWHVVKQHFPFAEYNIREYADGKMYLFDETLGYMVQTSVTIENDTKICWLPVMDSRNNSMRNKPYTYKTKTYDVTVEAATMFDINTALMRCLAKNLAMHGLGLYIYAGEDLPFTWGEDVIMPKPDVIALKEPLITGSPDLVSDELPPVQDKTFTLTDIKLLYDLKQENLSKTYAERIQGIISGKIKCDDLAKVHKYLKGI